ncbi:hypothetical protein EHI8A_173470 [Entamoeba histolytica HM-1:IMSS-B]|uniref:Uncharacterized protein n=6 Tax=Entamoeba histolytica TaxID=5759 RepID=C4M3G9_ENTH1|nr:hypothetical protein EHI_017640 [Entamoeba histolytica HM-1:IMSS]EMD43523.1 Hypothetical protein EHI5A_196170 [Entamoeba histolytica KU27]EMH74671.1 hypothetical protein EHI8A_173470 [Entamoeba histolytica HM-1:IMSS-B]EMS16358.1 hypothetical protein KM1_253990 [Entamoeba histolytica HM-3:IMSS]ENY60090.1 hypothetical protein EHI7A_155530 [Entamoeba histolytica HM-1:IMSS-A]GAT95850.1 hypothetical protein CL6EHI_017640 [Entamoeba histolytica]|eukprot:XP_650781.1 hypothetical protein EHI_017640 [Entamoeba histolytica HM-1:IMSS]
MTNLSVFIPVNPLLYEQVDSQVMYPSKDKMVVRESSINDNSLPSGRRYRQSELTQQISNIRNEIFRMSQMIANSRSNSPNLQLYNSKLKSLESILHQKQKHLLRLQKNVIVQKSIRNKKRSIVTQDN